MCNGLRRHERRAKWLDKIHEKTVYQNFVPHEKPDKNQKTKIKQIPTIKEKKYSMNEGKAKTESTFTLPLT